MIFYRANRSWKSQFFHSSLKMYIRELSLSPSRIHFESTTRRTHAAFLSSSNIRYTSFIFESMQYIFLYLFIQIQASSVYLLLFVPVDIYLSLLLPLPLSQSHTHTLTRDTLTRDTRTFSPSLTKAISKRSWRRPPRERTRESPKKAIRGIFVYPVNARQRLVRLYTFSFF